MDVAIRPGGDLQVQETIVLTFEAGTFHRFWRDLPTTRTDGIEILGATLDGAPVPPGSAPGHVTISGSHRVRVEWTLPPTGPSTHTFGLRYVAHGVAHSDNGADIVSWNALPVEHAYRIDRATVAVSAPVRPSSTPAVESHRVAAVRPAPSGAGVVVRADGIRPNGWIAVTLRFPPRSIAPTAPRWVRAHEAALAEAPWWAVGSGVLFLGCLAFLPVLRAGYSAPMPVTMGDTEPAPPEDRAPALAAALAANGRTQGPEAVATLLDLADRGVLEIVERPRTLGQRHYDLHQVPGSYDLAPHEETALRIAFADASGPVTMSRAHGRLVRRGRRFAASVADELAANGQLDPDRRDAARRLRIFGASLCVAAPLAVAAGAVLIPRHEAWPLLPALALGLGGITALIMSASMTMLSDEGLVRAARWRAFKRHLKALASGRGSEAASAPARWSILAIALGLGYYWSRYLKHHPGAVPSWFRALDGDGSAAWAAFVGSHAATGTAGGGAAGAAGGGASGAA
ncbi:MAG TPA: DUF2207 domain-containing protein [Vicinamibacterales bacterium]|nr:DUF2207 domain-containing protein [Vicinamibacterales bacterium]